MFKNKTKYFGLQLYALWVLLKWICAKRWRLRASDKLGQTDGGTTYRQTNEWTKNSIYWSPVGAKKSNVESIIKTEIAMFNYKPWMEEWKGASRLKWTNNCSGDLWFGKSLFWRFLSWNTTASKEVKWWKYDLKLRNIYVGQMNLSTIIDNTFHSL